VTSGVLLYGPVFQCCCSIQAAQESADYKDSGSRQPVIFSHYGGLSLRRFEITQEELGSGTAALRPKRPKEIPQEETTEECFQ
jgi:hypothetical protein